MDGSAFPAAFEPEVSGRVGPNAVTQLAAALGPEAASLVFGRAGLLSLLAHPPGDMIDEEVPAALFRALWQTLDPDDAAEIAAEAGRRTADYVLAHRIPRVAQIVLRVLPPSLAAPLLLRAIQNNAWTFAGSGECGALPGRPALIEIKANPLAMPECVWHAAVFARLFQRLVARETRVRHTACCREGAAACRFEIALDGA